MGVLAVAGVSRSATSAPIATTATSADLDAVADDMLRRSPQLATTLGLDRGGLGFLSSRLDERSRSGLAADAEAWSTHLSRLPSAAPDGPSRVDLEAVRYALGLAHGGSRFTFGDNSLRAAMSESATPYMISQLTGDWQSVPDFLDTQHRIADAADAQAYLARLKAFGVALDQETETVRADAGRGVILPRFALESVLAQMRALRATPAGQTRLVRSLVERGGAAGLTRVLERDATMLVAREVMPALGRQIDRLAGLLPKASEDVGVSRLPDGEAYYAWLMRVATSTDMTASDVHELGLAQTEEIRSRMDGLLRREGLNKGSVGSRMQALGRDPRYIFPNTDAGRVELVAYLNELIAKVRTRLPAMFAAHLRADVIVRRVPPETEAGAPLGYMNGGPLNGSRPSIYYINLRDTAVWPKWTLPTLTFHETIPGHVWQQSYVKEGGRFHPIRSMMDFNAYDEGWALYGEQLADESGLYDDNPLGRLGFLQFQLFRAGRLVADTGIHTRGWTRGRAIDFLVDLTGRPIPAITSEVNRYCVVPAQSCGYKIGHSQILGMRARAERRLGAAFDKRRFDDVVISTGSVPLTVLDGVTARYV